MEQHITLEFSVAKLQIKTNLEWGRYSEQNREEYTPSIPIYRRYSFLKKILKYKTCAKFNAEFVE
jgi:hypothetical protein